ADVMEREVIGGLKIGARQAEVIARLGTPAATTPPNEEAATGDVVSQWTWPGVELWMARDGQDWVVRMFKITAPSTLATSRGIRIGSTRAELAVHYIESTEDEGHDRATTYLVGSIYGGEAFTLVGGKVTEILLGVMAF